MCTCLSCGEWNFINNLHWVIFSFSTMVRCIYIDIFFMEILLGKLNFCLLPDFHFPERSLKWCAFCKAFFSSSQILLPNFVHIWYFGWVRVTPSFSLWFQFYCLPFAWICIPILYKMYWLDITGCRKLRSVIMAFVYSTAQLIYNKTTRPLCNRPISFTISDTRWKCKWTNFSKNCQWLWNCLHDTFMW